MDVGRRQWIRRCRKLVALLGSAEQKNLFGWIESLCISVRSIFRVIFYVCVTVDGVSIPVLCGGHVPYHTRRVASFSFNPFLFPKNFPCLLHMFVVSFIYDDSTSYYYGKVLHRTIPWWTTINFYKFSCYIKYLSSKNEHQFPTLLLCLGATPFHLAEQWVPSNFCRRVHHGPPTMVGTIIPQKKLSITTKRVTSRTVYIFVRTSETYPNNLRWVSALS